MKRFTIKIETVNAAFEDPQGNPELRGFSEVMRILKGYYARCIETHRVEDAQLRDLNGNTVGRVFVD